MRPQPSWLIPDDVDYQEVELGRLKSGKEAEVFVVERSYAGRTCLLAHKRYRPRRVSAKGELAGLGFERANSFMNDLAYRDGRRFAKSRDQRAVDRMTGYGKTLLTRRWTGHELDIMQRAWNAGVPVPYPVGSRGDGLLMQYVGDHAQAAPRLAQARLGGDALGSAWEQLVDGLRALVGAGFVHADLSAYNVLWWDSQVWLIDFPQAVDITVNPHALDFLHRDVANVGRWFAARHFAVDVDALYGELVSLACSL
ncbi:MAG TPA: RIO1 family regulatory kinase/ATPase [Acidimicrobiales bacterium]|nr:RIO1 family regulatory kinase/ATPase [Acidimicrobiales bacterium]